MKKVSVIIPVYNTEQYLEKCILSVVNQTYQNLEIILIDDGSTDNSGIICDSWQKKDNRIIVFHKKNEGQGVARNLALDNATGDYVLFVDSDDYIDLAMVEKMVEATRDNDIDVVLCGIVADHGCIRKQWTWYQENLSCDNEKLMLEYVKGKIYTGPVCKLFKKEIFDKIRFPNFRANEDAFIMHKLFGNCRTAYIINENLYIQNFTNISTERSPFNLNKLRGLDCAIDLREYIKSHYPHYIQFVENKPAKTILMLLEKIFAEKDNQQFQSTIVQLKEQLIVEKEHLLQRENQEEILKDINFFLNHPKRFVRQCRANGYREKLKMWIKKILSKRTA